MNRLIAFFYKFDLFGQTVASLNVKGQTMHYSAIGSFVSLIITGLLAYFLVLRTEKLYEKLDSEKYEVTQGFNLMTNDTENVNLRDYNYNVGLGAYGIKWK